MCKDNWHLLILYSEPASDELVQRYLRIGGFPDAVTAESTEYAKQQVAEIYYDMLLVGPTPQVDRSFKGKMSKFVREKLSNSGFLMKRSELDNSTLDCLLSGMAGLMYSILTMSQGSIFMSIKFRWQRTPSPAASIAWTTHYSK